MSSRTQLRLQQITGSFGDAVGQIHDHKTIKAAKNAIVAADLSGSLSFLAASIRRIHGAVDFSNQNEGQFDTSKFDVNTGGAFTADAVGASHLITNGGLTISGSTGLGLKADSGTLDIETRLGAIDLDAGGALTLDSATSVALGTANSGVAISIGHANSEVTINDNLTVAGDLTVSGDTVTLDVTNKSIQDQLIILNSGSAANAVKQDVGIIFAQPDISRVLYVDDSDSSKFVFGTTYTSGTATGANAVDKLGDADVRMGTLQAASANITGLTNQSIVFVGSGGALAEDATNLKYDAAGDILTVGVNKFAVTASNGQTLVGKLLIDGDETTLDGVGGTLTAETANDFSVNSGRDIIFDVNGPLNQVEFKLNGARHGSLFPTGTLPGSNALLLSSSAGLGLHFDGNNGQISFTAAENSNGNGLQLSLESQGAVNFRELTSNNAYLELDFANTELEAHQDLRMNSTKAIKFNTDQQLIKDAGSGNLLVSASNGLRLEAQHVHIDNTANATGKTGELRFLDQTGGQYAGFKAADSTTTYTLTLPDTKGSIDGVFLKLVNASAGTLAFEDIAASSKKFIHIVPAAGIAKSATLNLATAPRFGSSEAINNLETNALGGKLLDVFVNGQLLISGSASEIATPAVADYRIVDADELQFAFDLEHEDVVQVIKRG